VVPEAVHALRSAYSLTVQWRTNPLTRLRAIAHCTDTRPTGRNFGCHYASTDFRFGGHAGLLLHPETEEAGATSLKWAIMSAYTAAPTCTVLLVPAIEPCGYARYLRHPRVHLICRIPRAGLRVSRLQPNGVTTDRGAKYAADLVFVAKAPGIITYLQVAAAVDLSAQLQMAWHLTTLPNTAAHDWLAGIRAAGDSQCPPPPKRFCNADQLAPLQVPLPTTTNNAPPAATISQLLTGVRCLRFQPGAHVYTDGSKTDKGSIGCGIYSELTPHTDHRVKPAGHDAQLNTVPYAELAAQLHGIE
jgi:hypothetical protein